MEGWRDGIKAVYAEDQAVADDALRIPVIAIG